MSRGGQLIRQWQLLRALQNHRHGICVDDLAAQMGYGRRTIERDICVLKEVNFPISSELRDFGKKFWKLESNFLSSDKVIIGVTEIISLHLARQLLSPLSGTQLGDGLDGFCKKIEKMLPKSAFDHFLELDKKVYVKMPVREVSLADDKFLHIIRKGLSENRAIVIKYKKSGKEEAYSTELHPYGMIYYGSSFYVTGFSAKSNGIRMFKLHRISDAVLTNKPFERPEEFSLEQLVHGSFGVRSAEGKAITIRCVFRGWAANVVREQKWHSTQVIENDTDNELVASFLLDSTIEFKRWFLGFGCDAHIIEPETFRQEVGQILKKSLQNYKSNN